MVFRINEPFKCMNLQLNYVAFPAARNTPENASAAVISSSATAEKVLVSFILTREIASSYILRPECNTKKKKLT